MSYGLYAGLIHSQCVTAEGSLIIIRQMQDGEKSRAAWDQSRSCISLEKTRLASFLVMLLSRCATGSSSTHSEREPGEAKIMCHSRLTGVLPGDRRKPQMEFVEIVIFV